MNTPAHLALSVYVWRTEQRGLAVAAIVFGALLPDLSMIGFYLYQKLWLLTPESVIWSSEYYHDRWQLLFDAFNSIPIMLAIAVACLALNFRIGFLIAASALLHMLLDFPLHHDDAHRHFLPFTNWRFQSPVSYWDPRYFGHIFIWVELALTLLLSYLVSRQSPSKPMRLIAILILLSYIVFSFFAFAHWM